MWQSPLYLIVNISSFILSMRRWLNLSIEFVSDWAFVNKRFNLLIALYRNLEVTITMTSTTDAKAHNDW